MWTADQEVGFDTLQSIAFDFSLLKNPALPVAATEKLGIGCGVSRSQGCAELRLNQKCIKAGHKRNY
jgi:hypothetical protein